MAMGSGYSGYSGGNGSNDLDLTYYSRIRFMSNDGKLSLAFSFWKGTLKVAIQNRTVQNVRDSEIVHILISPFKARAFVECINKIIESNGIPEVWGVDTGSAQSGIRSVIAIGNGEDGPFLYINKINDDRDYDVKEKFVFRSGVNNIFKFTDLDNDKSVDENKDDLTLIMLRDIFADFARSASGALAVGGLDLQRYEIARLTRFLNNVANTLNIDPFRNIGGNNNSNGGNYNNNNSGNRQNGSFFNNNNGSNGGNQGNSNRRQGGYTTIDDLESELD